jgi:hypothetical protein
MKGIITDWRQKDKPKSSKEGLGLSARVTHGVNLDTPRSWEMLPESALNWGDVPRWKQRGLNERTIVVRHQLHLLNRHRRKCLAREVFDTLVDK